MNIIFRNEAAQFDKEFADFTLKNKGKRMQTFFIKNEDGSVVRVKLSCAPEEKIEEFEHSRSALL